MVKWTSCGILLSLFILAGCSEQDAERIEKVSGKALDKASELTNNAGDKIGLSIRNAKAGLDHLEVAGRVHARLKWDQALEGASIKVQATHEEVTLTGKVKDEVQRRRAVELAETTTGVEKVNETLEIVAVKQGN